MDLRNKPDVVASLKEQGEEPITYQQGFELAKKIGAKKYIECSALTQENLAKVFEEAVKVVLMPSKTSELDEPSADKSKKPKDKKDKPSKGDKKTGDKKEDCSVM
jgi:hypothetical protein